MTRSLLQPIRTRRMSRSLASPRTPLAGKPAAMTAGTRKTLVAIGALWISFAASASAATTAPATSAGAGPVSVDPLARGRYIVERVGMCADCHSPRTEKGEFDRSRWLLGSALPFQPTVPMPWSPAAPPIAGLPSMSEADGIAFLQTGKRPDGSMPRPPMPEFRLSFEDASAVVAYLKSLAK